FHAGRFSDDMATDFIEHMVSVLSVCVENNVNFELMRRTSFIDTLTGVNNRRFLEQRLIEEIDRSQRNGETLSCLFLDIDFFKAVNDTHGHQAGDQVLIVVAGTIKKLLRNNDVLARYGGEEFVALLSGIDDTRLQAIAERIRSTVQALRIDLGGKFVEVTISIGTATYDVATMEPAASSEVAVRLIEAADAALYRAKRNGRNRVENNGKVVKDLTHEKKALN
ncbi:MAG: GGDEF domain-containing protein, partial [Gammaproteobacteria bacterium]